MAHRRNRSGRWRRGREPGTWRDGAPEILVVDDDADCQMILQMVLEQQGFRVATAANGLEALALLRATARPDVIVCDLMMPRMSGWEFAAEKARDPALVAIPLIIVSAVSDAAHEPRPIADAALRKPLDVARLVEVIQQLLVLESPAGAQGSGA